VEMRVVGTGCGVKEREETKNYRGEIEEITVAALLLVRSWVD